MHGKLSHLVPACRFSRCPGWPGSAGLLPSPGCNRGCRPFQFKCVPVWNSDYMWRVCLRKTDRWTQWAREVQDECRAARHRESKREKPHCRDSEDILKSDRVTRKVRTPEPVRSLHRWVLENTEGLELGLGRTERRSPGTCPRRKTRITEVKPTEMRWLGGPHECHWIWHCDDHSRAR